MPTIYQLTEELQGMNDWYSLGVALRVHPNKLQEIQYIPSTGTCAITSQLCY